MNKNIGSGGSPDISNKHIVNTNLQKKFPFNITFRSGNVTCWPCSLMSNVINTPTIKNIAKLYKMIYTIISAVNSVEFGSKQINKKLLKFIEVNPKNRFNFVEFNTKTALSSKLNKLSINKKSFTK